MYAKLAQYCRDRNVDLVVVSKTRSNEAILEIYNQGHRNFGENRVSELVQKKADLPDDIRWHAIGHLQSKKVKKIADFVHLIHSGDRISVLEEINKQGEKCNRIIDVLLQIKIASEATKYGWEFDELTHYIDQNKSAFPFIRFRGVMGMATFTENQSQIHQEFATLTTYFGKLKSMYADDGKINFSQFDTISMGMSGDYKIAIEEGATMIRVGSLLF